MIFEIKNHFYVGYKRKFLLEFSNDFKEDGEMIGGIKKFDLLADPPFSFDDEYTYPDAFVVKSEFMLSSGDPLGSTVLVNSLRD